MRNKDFKFKKIIIINEATRRHIQKKTLLNQQSILDQQWCQAGHQKKTKNLYEAKRMNNNEETNEEYIEA